jgi:hypothetical protein
MLYLTGPIMLVVGFAIGLDIPDWDLRVGFLTHRSILTHGLLLPVVCFWIAHKKPVAALRLFALGICLAAALHLSFDLFPRAWKGFALIHIPVLGRAGAVFSWLWIALSVVITLHLALLLIRTLFELSISTIGLLGSFVLYATGEAVFFGLPLITLIVAGWLAMKWLSDSAKVRLRDYLN